MGWIIGLVCIAVIIIWFISAQRRLAFMDENINNAMSQIGVQQSSRWDALIALLDLTKGYAEHEYKTILDTTKNRAAITGSSTAGEAAAQDNMIADALSRIMAIAENYPDLKANQNYIKTMDSVNQYENMVRQSRLIYNDSVTKLNRSIRMFPMSIAAAILGFKSREYLEAQQTKADMPEMK